MCARRDSPARPCSGASRDSAPTRARLHTSRILRLSENLPVVIEIVDTPEQIDRVVPILYEMVTEGMLTLERVQIVSYRSSYE